jgi:hypothetical protein
LSLHSLPLGGIKSSSFRGTFKVKSQRTGDTEPPNKNFKDLNSKFYKSLPYKLVIGCIPLYAVLRIAQKIFQELPNLIQNSVKAGLPFACASNAIDKHPLLKAIPSSHDIKWGLARSSYLFNTQLEKNLGTYVLKPQCSLRVLTSIAVCRHVTIYDIRSDHLSWLL